MLWDLLLHLLTDIMPRHQILCDNILWLLAQGLYATRWRRDDDDDDDDDDNDADDDDDVITASNENVRVQGRVRETRV